MKKFLMSTVLATVLLLPTKSVSAIATVEQKIASLYVAFFRRAPDQKGFNEWVDKLNKGETLTDIAIGFSQHEMYTELYQNLDDRTFVEEIYKNVLGKKGDIEGIENHTKGLSDGTYGTHNPNTIIPINKRDIQKNIEEDNKGLSNGTYNSRADFIAKFCEDALVADLSQENFPNLTTDELIVAKQRQDFLRNKTEVALDFTTKLAIQTNIPNHVDASSSSDLLSNDEFKASQKIIEGVTEDYATLTLALNLNKILKNQEKGKAISILNNMTEITSETIADLNNSTAIVKVDKKSYIIGETIVINYKFAKVISENQLPINDSNKTNDLNETNDSNETNNSNDNFYKQENTMLKKIKRGGKPNNNLNDESINNSREVRIYLKTDEYSNDGGEEYVISSPNTLNNGKFEYKIKDGIKLNIPLRVYVENLSTKQIIKSDSTFIITSNEIKIALIDAGIDKNTTINVPITITGTAKNENFLFIIYKWQEGNTILASTAEFDYNSSIVGKHILTFTAIDENNVTASDEMLVTVIDESNEIPVAKAGDDVSIKKGESVTFDASNSFDPENGILKFSWSMLDKILSTEKSFTKSDLAVGKHTIILTVTDNKNATATDNLIVTVTDNEMENTDQIDVDKLKQSLNFEKIKGNNNNKNEVVEDLNLITKENSVNILWNSNNTDVVSNQGVVTRPQSYEGDKTVTLNATLSKGNINNVEIETITITVKAQSSSKGKK